jgi:hypothetical protein
LKLHSGKFLLGYRSDEVNLKVPDIPDSSAFVLHKNTFDYDDSYRPPMAACFVEPVPAVPPRPDTTHYPSLIDGIGKRMAYSPPKYNRNERRRFRKFVKNWLKQNMDPIDETEEFDFEEWLSTCPYTEKRKDEIRKAYPKECFINGEFDTEKFINYNIKIFTKEEYYPEYKHFRGIWARSDAAKGLLGPFFRKIEKKLFSLPYFIKKIPKEDRPRYINEFMNNEFLKFQATDYTSYESHFTTDMMDDCEFELYRYMSSKNVKAQLLCRLIFKIIATENFAQHKFFSVRVGAKRMSGEMNTSLGNGFSNLMFLLYACYKYKLDYSGPIIEGDDALIGLSKPIPQEYYTNMALNVKLDFVEDISEGSFCGLVYDPIELVNIREPIESICTTPWIPRKYAACNRNTYYSLLKSKGLSLMFEYPGCPIVYEYGKKIFELCSDYEIKFDDCNSYCRENNKRILQNYIDNKVPFKETGLRTRLLMEKIFKIPVCSQIRIEQEIKNMSLLDMRLPSVLEFVPDIWKKNYTNYVLITEGMTWHSITHTEFIKYDKLNIHRIIQLNPNKFYKNDLLISESDFYKNKLNKDPDLYKTYLERRNDAFDRINRNNRPI